jgi:hypothetical protein
MCLRSFGLYCSACLGMLFVSILCMCCSHFPWYCFISFNIFSAHVFSLIHCFFIYNERVSTDPILVSWQSRVYEPPEDGFKKRPKHVGASVKCFNVNFSAF